ncbi:glycine cleavage system protein R [Propioniciclava soli]|uniref:ACT domain-containing protein n=1 Tax=Propioniciclava soli TaxID=2775081 RepID=A0ABZ3CBT1_9ACTN|nr:ACT domain-containing protein [Propioniciclava soli]
MVLTVIGEDRPGLVQTLADVVTAHGGNWERSRMTELAGLFAGIVVIEAPDDRGEAFRGALHELGGVLHVGVHHAPGRSDAPTGQVITLELLGNDRAGIVKEVAAVFSRHGVSIDELTTDTREAPMAGGVLFEARLVAPLSDATDLDALRADLERLADELMVDITLAAS